MLKRKIRLRVRIFSFILLFTVSLPIFCAIDSIRRVAEDIGDPSAQFLLGHMYASGQEVAVDMAKAEKWYSKAAKQGHVEAQFRLAKIFHQKGDYKKAQSWFRESALKGWPDGQYHLGLMHMKGQGVPQDFSQARNLFEKASRRSHGEAMYEMGLIHYQGHGVPKSNKKARSWFFKASKNGSIRAQYELGRFLYAGIGGPKRIQQAKVWLEKASLGGIQDANPLLIRLGVKPKLLNQNKNQKILAEPSEHKPKKSKNKIIPEPKPKLAKLEKKPKSKVRPAIKRSLTAKAPPSLYKKAKTGSAKAQFDLGKYYEQKQDINKALHWYEQSALRGSLTAKMYLADMHSYGKGVSKNQRVALIWWRAAAEKHKHDEAFFQLGQSYNLGYGVKKDASRAMSWYEKAADKGHAMAQLELGRLYSSGSRKNISKARHWLVLANKQGVAEAQQLINQLPSQAIPKTNERITQTSVAVKPKRHLAATPKKSQPKVQRDVKKEVNSPSQTTTLQPWEMGKEMEQTASITKPVKQKSQSNKQSTQNGTLSSLNINNVAGETTFARRKDLLNIPFETLMAEAKQGQAKAQFALGLLYRDGSSKIIKETRQAIYWLTMASKQSHGEAQYELGRLYESNKQYSLSMKWYRSAANNSFVKANIAVGNLFRRGRGITRDYLRAAQWYAKASKKQDPEAQYLLAQMYQRGLGVNRDRLQALKWFKKSASNAYLPAQYQLGIIYFKMGGKNLQESKRWQGISWLSKAGEAKYLEAQLKLGKIYEEGDQVNKNFEKAAHWYGLAASQGHAPSQTRMGGYYREGRGVARNIDRALQWYHKAAEKGDSHALFALGEIHHRGESVEVNLKTASKWYQLAAEQGNRKARQRLRAIKKQAQPSNMVGSSFPN